MNLIEIFKRLFKKENNDMNHLINISDSFVLPTREIFKDNPEMLCMIESYKAEYKKVLSDKKLLFSMDLTNSVNENIRMYSELIANIFTDEGIVEGMIDTKIKMFYKVNKLNLYGDEISRLHLECAARLVALLEIFNERKIFMSKHKKDALLFAMNNLTNSLVVFEAQRGAIRVEKENYLNNYVMIDTEYNPKYDQKRSEFIQEKVKILNRVLPLFGKSLDSDNLSDLLILEKELEIYVYKNKAEVEGLKDKVSKLDVHTCDDTYPLDMNIFKNIFSLEKQALIFYFFGKDLIDINHLFRIYESKFLCVINMDDHSFVDIISDSLSLEHDCYTKLCQKKYDDIINGRNPVISELFMENSIDAIECISERCKIESLNATIIGPTTRFAKFVFAFDSTSAFIRYLDNGVVKIEENELLLGKFKCKNGTNNFISSYDISRDDLSIFDSIFTWNEFIPKISLYELININGDSPDLWWQNKWNYPLNELEFELYKLFLQASDYYKLPEGIKKIDCDNSIESEEARVFDNMVSCAKGKRLVLPDSLEVFHGRIFPTCSISDVVLNDNIKSVSMSLLGNVSENLIIPASLETIVDDIPRKYQLGYKFVWELSDELIRPYDQWHTLNKIGFNTLNTITFCDYENSKLLQNKESLRLLFADTLYIEKSKKTWTLKTKVKTLVLIEGDGEFVYTIDTKDLEWPLKSHNVLIKNEHKVAVENVVIDEFMALVESKVSYRLNGDKTLIKHSLL